MKDRNVGIGSKQDLISAKELTIELLVWYIIT